MSQQPVSMTCRKRLAILTVILLGSAAIAGGIIWWAGGHRATAQLAAGLVLVAVGIGLHILNVTAGDGFLQRQFGEAGAVQFRRESRRGWIGILLGGVLIGMYFLDREVDTNTKESQYRAAMERGRVAAKAGNWQAAADAFSDAIERDPGQARAFANRAVAYIRLGDLDRALDDLNESLRHDPNDARVTYNRGVVFYRKGDWDRALADFSEAIRIDPKYARAYLGRSAMHHARGDEANANADRQRAFELDPTLEKAVDVNLV